MYQVETQKRYAILVAGGSGTRMGTELPKQFLPLPNDVPILVQTFRTFAAFKGLTLIVVLPENHISYWQALVKEYTLANHLTVAGGATRCDSVSAGMLFVPDDALVAIHDGVRPFVTKELIEACYDAAEKSGAACAAVPSKDSLRLKLADGSSQAVDRALYFLVQTPQVFKASVWKQANGMVQNPAAYTDDASMVEAAGYPITLVEGSYSNVKITTPEDLL